MKIQGNYNDIITPSSNYNTRGTIDDFNLLRQDCGANGGVEPDDIPTLVWGSAANVVWGFAPSYTWGSK